MKRILLFFLSFKWILLFGQQKHLVSENNQIWFGYFNQTRITNGFGTWTDLHIRTKDDFTRQFSQSVIRVGASWYISDAAIVTAGIAWINHFPADNYTKISRTEYRPWAQIQWFTSFSKARVLQRIRFEERFMEEVIKDSTTGNRFLRNYRARINILWQIPLLGASAAPGCLSAIVNDECMINIGKSVGYNYFDQNRFFVGVGYQFTKRAALQLGYMNVFQQQPSGYNFRSVHAIRMFFFHNFDLRKPKKTETDVRK